MDGDDMGDGGISVQRGSHLVATWRHVVALVDHSETGSFVATCHALVLRERRNGKLEGAFLVSARSVNAD